jgi:hypothetical protein
MVIACVSRRLSTVNRLLSTVTYYSASVKGSAKYHINHVIFDIYDTKPINILHTVIHRPFIQPSCMQASLREVRAIETIEGSK